MVEFPKWKRELPHIPHKLINAPLELLVEFYKEHLQRDFQSGRLTPPEPFEMLRGFLLAAMQTYAGICILLQEKRPKRLMLQASILNRALFEIFATVVALTEDPIPRAQILAREHFKAMATRYNSLLKRFGSNAKWRDYLDVYGQILAMIIKRLNIPPQLQQNPTKIQDEWPTPGVMLHGRPHRKVPSFVTGTRLAVLKEVYESHYSVQSALAHGRAAVLGAAIMVDNPDSQWNPGQGESDLVATALILMACVLLEIECAGAYNHHPKLAELWTYLRDLDDEAKELWQLRYEELARRPRRGSGP